MMTLYIMCGRSFSGKTLLSKAIAKQKNCDRIALDEINEERGLVSGSEGLSCEEWIFKHLGK